MLTKKKHGSAEWTDADDAPPLTRKMREEAEVFVGDRFVQRGRGRPKADSVKVQVNMRLDRDTVGYLRASGPGWQTKTSEIVSEHVEEATLQAFDFPMEVSVKLPTGEVATGVGVVTIRAVDHESALHQFDASPKTNKLRALLNVRWQGQ
jgi:uncharacterized protein (DUF4415 family)